MKKIFYVLLVLLVGCCESEDTKPSLNRDYLLNENNDIRKQIKIIENAAQSETDHLSNLIVYYHYKYPERKPLAAKKADTIFQVYSFYKGQTVQFDLWFDKIKKDGKLSKKILDYIKTAPLKMPFDKEKLNVLEQNVLDTVVVNNVILKVKLDCAAGYLKTTYQQQIYPVDSVNVP